MIVVFLILFGLAIGSFLNVVILRVPLGKSIVFPASHCFTCKKNLKWYHNIPLFSWLFLGGKCAFCKTKISIQYPIIELLVPLIFLACYYKTSSFVDLGIHSFIFILLLALLVIDLKYKAVPDSLSIPALLLAFFAHSPLVSIEQALLYAGGFALLRIFVSFFLKKEAMGEADIIIAGVIGAMLGTPLGLVAIYLSAVFALFGFLAVRKSGYELPFIPFLSLGLFVTYFFDDYFLNLVGSIYG